MNLRRALPLRNLRRRLSFLGILGTALLMLNLPVSAQAASPSREYPQPRESGSRTLLAAPSGSMSLASSSGLLVSDMSVHSPQELVDTLRGDSPIPVSNVQFTGASSAGGMFSGGTGIVGFENGILLSTGNIVNVVGPNRFQAVTQENHLPGEPALGQYTYDAASLEFDFVPSTDKISFQYVFASDEYNEFANSEFNDAFAFFVNGQNQALVPYTSTPVSINTINGGNPIGTDPQNPQYFVNNDTKVLNTEMDGLTVVLTLTASVIPNQTNHLKMVIADVGDERFDSNVFIKAGSFTDNIVVLPSAPPETTPTFVPYPNAAGWNRSNVTVKLHAVSPIGESIKEVHYRVGAGVERIVAGADASVSVITEGASIVTFYAVDMSGNVEQPKTVTVNIDKTKPTIAGAYVQPNVNGWYNANVAINFNCADALSGLASCVGATTLGEGANQSVTGTATDKAGNTNTATVSKINIDKTKPVITATADRPATGDGWWNGPVTVSFTCSDALSGLDGSCPEAVPVTGEGQGQAVAGTIKDKAGNSNSARALINIDATAPAITGAPDRAPNADGWYNAPVTVTFACTDALAGIAGCTSPASLTAEGAAQSAAGTATDKAGNTASASVGNINIDMTAPETTATAPTGWQAPATVTLAATDGLSGIGQTYYSIDGGTVQTGSSLTITADGTHTVRYWSVDKAGNAETPKTVTVKVDQGNPTITPHQTPAPNAFGWNNTEVAVTFDCYDANGIASCTGNTFLTEQGAGQEVTGTATDLAGNTASATVTVNIDLTPPSINGAASTRPNADGWYNIPVTITFTCTDDLSGTDACTAPTTLATEGQGQEVTGQGTDRAGNSSSAAVTGISIDLTAPHTTATAPAGWQTTPVTVTLLPSDNLSGVRETYFTVDGGPTQTGTSLTVSTEGVHTVRYWSDDFAGNTEQPQTLTVQIDGAPPTITHTQTPAPNALGWNNTDVAVDFTCADTAGIASCTGDTMLTAEGQGQVVTGVATDLAGNTATDTATVSIDKTAPVTTATTAGTVPMLVTFAAADNLSGIDATYYVINGGTQQTGTSLSLTTGGLYTIRYWSTDRAGNAEPPKTLTLQLDSAPPTITHTQSPVPNPEGWNNTDVTVTFTCTDDSGIAFCTPPVTISSEGGGQAVIGTATDIAGNSATDTAFVSIDKTAPVVTYSGNAGDYTLDQPISIACTASDTLSGVAVTTCQPITGPAYAFAFGANTFTATATDRAGNISTQTVSFNVNVTVNGTCGVIDQLVSNQGVANSLCVKIKNSQEAAWRGNLKTELNNLDAYIQEVEAQRAKAKISNANADVLLRIAYYLQSAPPVEIDWRPGVGHNR